MDAPHPQKHQHRADIRRTVERMAPELEIDTTKVLTDEEMAVFQQQLAEQKAARELAAQEGRAGLRARLAKATDRAQKTRPYNPDEIQDEKPAD